MLDGRPHELPSSGNVLRLGDPMELRVQVSVAQPSEPTGRGEAHLERHQLSKRQGERPEQGYDDRLSKGMPPNRVLAPGDIEADNN